MTEVDAKGHLPVVLSRLSSHEVGVHCSTPRIVLSLSWLA